MMTQETIRKLNTLKLFGMAKGFDDQLNSTAASHLAFEDRFGLLVDQEATFRDNRRLKRLLTSAKLREPACIEDVHYDAGRGINRNEINSLALCSWATAGVNVLITGEAGTGKTWLGCAFGNQACRHGLSVSFQRVSLLLEELAIAHGDGSFRRRLQQLAKVDLLILDDLGLTPLAQSARNDLLEVIEQRSGLKGTLVTSQLPIDHWHDYLSKGNATVADAILDRLLSGAHRLTLKGESMRKKLRPQPST